MTGGAMGVALLQFAVGFMAGAEGVVVIEGVDPLLDR
jgi:hypothetical protein